MNFNAYSAVRYLQRNLFDHILLKMQGREDPLKFKIIKL
ncbi:hypothetical protein ADIARSV_3408 [Arcticibacter svalbardensis MN12-7]|uniref:Uncharacterized protein n=1 Tax=Arcticibacter svalbardensis MN12-7 TaxID=1150600 RepID=R9GWK4_9SPHI|nr:hypothetical protein ADIARSV_3408 [Arcticibacter svalbardensis MN12-7]